MIERFYYSHTLTERNTKVYISQEERMSQERRSWMQKARISKETEKDLNKSQ